jgi:hypothetical protein
MADRSLRGTGIGARSLQSDVGVEFSARKRAIYRTADGSTFEVIFAEDAEVPTTWSSPKNGQEGTLLDAQGDPVESEAVEAKAGRTHWDMLLERRTREELEEILEERLQYLRSRRGA